MKLTTRQKENSKAAVSATKLMKRLNRHVMGEIELSASQVRATEILLRKLIPDLKAVEVSGEIETRKPSADPYYGQTSEEWLKQSAGHLNPDHKPH